MLHIGGSGSSPRDPPTRAEGATDRCTVCAYIKREPPEEDRVSVPDRVAQPVTSGPADPVLYEVRDTGVALLTLNRPDRMNGWGGGLATTFYARLDDAEANPAVRAIVVTGSGRAFCAGADMGDLTTMSGATVAAAGGTDVGKLVGARHPHFVTTLRKPIIAAINGACAGMGLTLALVCDVRFAAEGAKFTTSFARRGLIAEYGISWILPRIVGTGVAMDLLLSGRVFLADEAARLGLVNDVVAPEDLLPRAIAYAEDIAANCAPSSLAVIKQQVYADTMRDVFEASEHAEKLMHESMTRPDFIEGITSFFEKRPPNFPPLTPEQEDTL
jgi:enoyl-CoA hydratase/carnithine racemase